MLINLPSSTHISDVLESDKIEFKKLSTSKTVNSIVWDETLYIYSGMYLTNFFAELAFIFLFLLVYKKRTNHHFLVAKCILAGLVGLGFVYAITGFIPAYLSNTVLKGGLDSQIFLGGIEDSNMRKLFYWIKWNIEGTMSFYEVLQSSVFLLLSICVSLYSILFAFLSSAIFYNVHVLKLVASICELLGNYSPKKIFNFSMVLFTLSTGFMGAHAYLR